MRYSKPILLPLGLGVALCVTHVLGTDPQTQVAPTEGVAEGELGNAQALKEISHIREKLGGSVLKGSVLDSSGDAGFDAELRNMLELPNKTAATKPPPRLTQSQIVTMLRTHSSRLDGIANQIEKLRQYNNADQLRDMADQLRRVARQMDAPVAGFAKEFVR